MTRQRKVQGMLVITVAVVLALGALALLSGAVAYAQGPNQTPCPYGNMMGNGMMGSRGMMGNGGMMGNNAALSGQPCAQITGMMGMMGGYGMMGNGGMMGMMGGNGMMGSGGMMGGGAGYIGRFGPGTGMMGAWTPSADLVAGAKPLTLDKVTAIAKAYVAAWDSNTSLKLEEVMQFSNHFYGAAIEANTGRGAFEFLIDPQTGTVYAEPGPNMMWNLRYSTMARTMGFANSTADGDKLTVTLDDARKDAQAYLDAALPGTKVEEDGLAFYGYYTFDVTRDGKIVGMLSVNGYTGQVWAHRWHGDFVAESAQ